MEYGGNERRKTKKDLKRKRRAALREVFGVRCSVASLVGSGVDCRRFW